MEDEITKTIQGLKLNEKKKVEYQGVKYVLINKNNKLFYKSSSSLTFELICTAIIILLFFFLVAIAIATGIDEVGQAGVIIAIAYGLQWRILYIMGIPDLTDRIYEQRVKNTTIDFINKYGNVKILENN